MRKIEMATIILLILGFSSIFAKMFGYLSIVPFWMPGGLILFGGLVMFFNVFENPSWILAGAGVSFATQWGVMAFFCHTWQISAYYEHGGPILGFIAFFIGLMMDPGGRKKDRLDKKMNAFFKAGGVAGLLFMLITTGAY